MLGRIQNSLIFLMHGGERRGEGVVLHVFVFNCRSGWVSFIKNKESSEKVSESYLLEKSGKFYFTNSRTKKFIYILVTQFKRIFNRFFRS